MDEFINEPKSRGFSSKKILFVGGILLLIGVVSANRRNFR